MKQKNAFIFDKNDFIKFITAIIFSTNLWAVRDRNKVGDYI